MANPSPHVPVKMSKKTGKPVQRRPGQERYPWDQLRRDFIEGVPVSGTKDERVWPTLRELAEDNGVPYVRMRKRAAAERWTEHKTAAQNQARLTRLKKRAEQIEVNALDFDEKAFSIAKLGSSLVAGRLAEIGQEMQAKKQIRDMALQNLQNGNAVNKSDLYSAVRYSEIDGLASAAARFQEIGMKALGTDVQRIDINNLGGGGDTTVNVLNVSQELVRDDSERLGGVLEAMASAGLIPEEILDQLTEVDDEPNTIPSDLLEVEGEVVGGAMEASTELGNEVRSVEQGSGEEHTNRPDTQSSTSGA